MLLSPISQLLIFPFSFLFNAADQVFTTVSVTGLLWKSCKHLYTNDSSVDCEHLNETSNGEVTQRIQAFTGTWQTYNIIANILPLILVIPIIGAISDRHGRKYTILVGTLAMILGALLYFFEFLYAESAPFFVLPLVICLISFFGYNGTINLSCYSYIADTSSTKEILTIKMTGIYFVNSSGSIITGVIVSLFLNQLSFAYTLLIPLGIWAISLIYALLFLKQIPPKQQRDDLVAAESTDNGCENPAYQPETKSKVSISTDNPTESEESAREEKRGWFVKFKASLRSPFLRRKREGNFFWYIRALLLTSIIASIPSNGMNSVITIFCSGAPLHWDSSQILLYKSINTLMELIGMIISTFLFKRHLHLRDTSALLIGLISVMLRFILIGTAVSDAMMYISCPLGLFSGMILPLISSLMVQLVDANEVGQVLSIFWFGVGMGQLIASTGLMKLLTVTLTFYSGTVFLCVAGLLLLSILVNIWLHFDLRAFQTMHDKT